MRVEKREGPRTEPCGTPEGGKSRRGVRSINTSNPGTIRKVRLKPRSSRWRETKLRELR
jgi:hypothetical protein